MSHKLLMAERQGYLLIVAALERELGEEMTTAEMRQWFRKFGPAPEVALAQLEKVKRQPERSATE